MKTFKLWHLLVSIFCVLFIMLVVYGIKTDCPNTAGYVYCGDSDGWSLHHWGQQKVGE
ncbi:hypothetical protein GCM10011613_16000 [Cellvibrio zantedeschiae]|uniref:Uncharacterized protein n=1 Tax=Cellvibrio zantedeschiae TaxID=1237077 RepID=A0ABQ3AZS5_9GAMM|nr:hypothetical protein [Cellvibrio zantedeschiae]GGY71899.1 hypothetical protein GCM10011613_16000 [Cellvibrio zantedeschiae]